VVERTFAWLGRCRRLASCWRYAGMTKATFTPIIPRGKRGPVTAAVVRDVLE
jgi:transposase